MRRRRLQIDLEWEDREKGMKVSFRIVVFAQKSKALVFDKGSFLIDPLLSILKRGFPVDDCKQFRGHYGYAPDESRRGNSCFTFTAVFRKGRGTNIKTIPSSRKVLFFLITYF